ncbi:MAG: signal peptidase II [Acidimicrobiales bacterium]
MSHGRRLASAALIVVGCIALDQITKEWALNRLSDGSRIEIVPTLEFDLAFNSGFSFSTGSGSGNLVGLLVIALSIFIAVQIWREARPIRTWLYAAILGGALGNLLDRVFRADEGFLSGKVVDFIDVTWYAVFNVADMFVVCGCIVFVIDELVHSRRATKTEDEPREPMTAP